MAEYDFGLSGKIAIEQLDDMFRGAGFGQAGEAADVGEEDGDFLALSRLRLRQGIASNQGADDAWINEAAKQLQGVFALASFAEIGFQGAGCIEQPQRQQGGKGKPEQVVRQQKVSGQQCGQGEQGQHAALQGGADMPPGGQNHQAQNQAPRAGASASGRGRR